jgi:hypothetical protein
MFELQKRREQRADDAQKHNRKPVELLEQRDDAGDEDGAVHRLFFVSDGGWRQRHVKRRRRRRRRWRWRWRRRGVNHLQTKHSSCLSKANFGI